jgi:hypothetical protein
MLAALLVNMVAALASNFLSKTTTRKGIRGSGHVCGGLLKEIDAPTAAITLLKEG